MEIRCPRCGAKTSFRKNPNKPFCSERCKLIDLGRWMSEGYALSSESEDEEEDGVPGHDAEGTGE